MAREFIYHMRGLSKTYPGNRKVLENIHLSFYPDAKIGVLGLNGAGKSTLLRIMAGIDKDWTGEAWVAEGARVGYLPQEPQLDPTKTVRENVMEGVAENQAILDRYNETRHELLDETADEMTAPPGRDRGQGPVGSRLQGRSGDGRPALPARRHAGRDSSGGERRRVALCKLLLEQPELLLLDEPTNHLDAETVGWLGGHLRAYPGAILIVTHDRYFLDNVAELDSRTRPRPRHPVRGQLLRLARAEAEAARAGGPRGRRRAGARIEREREWVVGLAARPGRPSPRRASSATRSSWRSRRTRRRPPRRSSFRSPSGSGERHRGRAL